MGEECVVAKIRLFVEQCENLDELPHRFDDTLLDKLIDSIQYRDDEVTSYVENLTRNFDVETCCVPIQILLRLLDGSLRHGTFPNMDLLREFLVASEFLLEQERPPKLLHDLFVVYTNPVAFGSRTADEWECVLNWALRSIDDNSTSVFVRRQLAGFVCSFSASDAERLAVIENVLDIFSERVGPTHSSPMVSDVVASIIAYFAPVLSQQRRLRVIDCVRQSTRIGESVLRLVAKLYLLDTEAKVDFSPGSWKNESNRVDVICLIATESCASSDVLMSIMDSPAFRFSHFIAIMPLLDHQQIRERIEAISKLSSNRRIVPLSDVITSIPILHDKVPLDVIASFLLNLGDRILESPSILMKVCDVYGQEVIDDVRMQQVANRVKVLIEQALRSEEWEHRDTALEVAFAFPIFAPTRNTLLTFAAEDPSPYVRSAALRLLQKLHGGIPIEMAVNIVLTSPDPEPRLVAMKTVKSCDIDVSRLQDVVASCLNDDDAELRKDAVEAATKLLNDAPNRDAAVEMRTMLGEWVDDSQIGDVVRRLLGKPCRDSADESVRVACEMLAALEMHTAEDDTMDCY